MAYIRFFRRIRLFSNCYLNISKKGLSISFNGKIIRITINKHGIRYTTGIKGTGLSITEYIKHKK